MKQKKPGDEIVLKAQEFIENNPTEILAVDDTRNKFNLGRRTFEAVQKMHGQFNN